MKINLNVNIYRTSDVHLHQLNIYSEKGLLAKRPLNQSKQDTYSESFDVNLRGEHRWLRVEVRGTQSATGMFRRGDGFHLGTTNFFKINPTKTGH